MSLLKPCRSPYCECEAGKCSHPGFYDARSELSMSMFASKADLEAARNKTVSQIYDELQDPWDQWKPSKDIV